MFFNEKHKAILLHFSRTFIRTFIATATNFVNHFSLHINIKLAITETYLNSLKIQMQAVRSYQIGMDGGTIDRIKR